MDDTAAKAQANNRKRGRGVRVAMPRLLKDLRHVYTEPDEAKDTPGQKALRAMFKDDPKGFLAQLQTAEKAHREDMRRAQAVGEKAKGEEGGEREEPEDAGTGKALEIINRLIDEYEGGGI